MYIYLENEYDFMKLDKAAKDGRYGIAIFQAMFYRRPKPAHMVSNHNTADAMVLKTVIWILL